MEMLLAESCTSSAHPEPLCHLEWLLCLCSGNAPPQECCTSSQGEGGHCPAMNKHQHSICPSPGLGNAEQGQEGRYFWG